MFPLSDAQVTQRLALVALGGEFEALEDPEKLKAVRLAEGVWRPRKWRVGHNPFLTNGPAEALQGTLFLHARHLYFARSQGSLTHTRDLWPRDIERVLRPYLVSASRPIQHIGAPAQASTSGSGASGSGASTSGSGDSTPGSGDSPASWAVEGNKDPIPGDKLANAPDSGDGSGLDQSAVDLRVSALVAAWALVSGPAKIVLRKLPDVVSNANAIAGTSVAVRSWTAQRVRQAINAGVPAWARIGNLALIPAMKLPKPTGGVTLWYPPSLGKAQDRDGIDHRITPGKKATGDADVRNRYWARFTKGGVFMNSGVLTDLDEIQVFVEIRETRVLTFLCFRVWKGHRFISSILVRLVWLIPSKLEKGFRLLATPRILTGRSIIHT